MKCFSLHCLGVALFADTNNNLLQALNTVKSIQCKGNHSIPTTVHFPELSPCWGWFWSENKITTLSDISEIRLEELYHSQRSVLGVACETNVLHVWIQFHMISPHGAR